MVKQNQSDIDFTDGCVYIYSITLSTGTFHSYYFEANDGNDTTRLPADGEYNAPIVISIVEKLPPTAYAGKDITIFEGETVQFNGSGYDVDGSILVYEWDFDGDGYYDWNSTTSGSTTNKYLKAGKYYTKFKVTDDNGATATDTMIVTVKEESTTDKDTGIPREWLLLSVIIIIVIVMFLGRVLLNQKKSEPPSRQDKTHQIHDEQEYSPFDKT
jgi:hypothetical protein